MGNAQPCPRCGGTAWIADGRFSAVDGLLQMLSGPMCSLIAMARLTDVLKVAAATAAEDPIAIVEDASPEVGSWLRRTSQGWSRSDVLALIAVLLTLLIYVDQRFIADSVSGEDIERLIDVIEEGNANRGPDEGPGTTPPGR